MGLLGHLLAAGLDAHERGLVVQRSELCQFVDLGDDIVIDEHGAIEVLAALHYAVPHGVDVVQRVDGLGGAARQRLQHEGHGGVVIGHLGVSMTTSFSSMPCLWKASAEPTRSQMPLASSFMRFQH